MLTIRSYITQEDADGRDVQAFYTVGDQIAMGLGKNGFRSVTGQISEINSNGLKLIEDLPDGSVVQRFYWISDIDWIRFDKEVLM